jgi:hypothetical protein
MNVEQELLNQALEAFEATTGLHARALSVRPRGLPDADAFVEIAADAKKWRYPAEIKPRFMDGQTGPWLAHRPPHSLLITTYVNPEQALRFRELGLEFIDSAGNAYIQDPPLVVFVRGIKPTKAPEVTEMPDQLGLAGVKVVFALLAYPPLLHRTHRDIAKAAAVSIGSVTNVLHQLQATGHLRGQDPEKRKLVEKEKLLDLWASEYAKLLRPKTLLGRFAAPEADWWKRIEPAKFGILLGGEAGAALISKYLAPEIITVYAMEIPKQLILGERLRKEPAGNVECRQAFWNLEDQYLNLKGELVHPILIYADLLATGIGRNIETAKMIYDNEIVRNLKQDP